MKHFLAFFAAAWSGLLRLAPTLKQGATFAAGMAVEMMRSSLWNEKKLAQQWKDILDEERKARERGVDGAAGRLRRSKYTVPDSAP